MMNKRGWCVDCVIKKVLKQMLIVSHEKNHLMVKLAVIVVARNPP